MPDDEAIAGAMTDNSSDLAQTIFDALSADTSYDGHPYISGDADLHRVTLDGTFDLVAAARKMRAALKTEMLALLKAMNE